MTGLTGSSATSTVRPTAYSPHAAVASARHHGFGRTGNIAFDDWREKELERLAEERRKLDETLKEFDSYARELRRAKDQEEFDRFMADRDRAQNEANDKPRGSSTPGLLDDA